MATLRIAGGSPATAQDMSDEATRLTALSKLLARTQSKRARLIRAFDRAVQLFDQAEEGSPEQVQALAQLVELEVKIGQEDRHLQDLLSHVRVTR